MAQIGLGESQREMVAFVRAVELGGFSSAARDLGLTPSAVSKLVTRLEDRLGVRLMNRTTRRLALTPEGEIYFERGRRILAAITDLEAEVVRARGRPRGLLRMNVGVAFGLHQLPWVLPRFLERYPEVELDLTVTDRVVDLVRDAADIAVRSGAVTDESVVARKITDMERVICAAPTYLARHGTPRVPEDLLGHDCLVISGAPALARWPFDTPDGRRVIEVQGDVKANNAETVLQLALIGVGIVRLADMVVGEEIRRGRLVPILTDSHHREPLPLYAIFQPGRHRSPKVAAMVEFLLETFGHAPWRSGTVATAKRRKG